MSAKLSQEMKHCSSIIDKKKGFEYKIGFRGSTFVFHHPSLAAVAAAAVANEIHTLFYVECIEHRPSEALQPHIWSFYGNTYHRPDAPN